MTAKAVVLGLSMATTGGEGTVFYIIIFFLTRQQCAFTLQKSALQLCSSTVLEAAALVQA